MHRAVRDYFLEFSTKFEGRVPWFYKDIKDLCTIGIGNLVDPLPYALKLKMVHKGSGRPASQAEIELEWRSVKTDPLLAKYGHRAAERMTSLRLTDEALEELVMGKLDEVDHAVRAQFPEYPDWPADGQLGLLSMAWAAGAGIFAGFPRFSAACREQDFLMAATECRLDDRHNPGLVPRNNANVELFGNAAIVSANGLDRSVLWYPAPVDWVPPLPFRHG